MARITTRPDFYTELRTRLGNVESDELKPTDVVLLETLFDALDELSTLAPLRKVHEQLGDGTTRRVVLDTAVGTWQNGLSRVNRVASVTKANLNDEQETELEVDEWRQARSATNQDILYLRSALSNQQTLRLFWQRPHHVDATTAANTTVPDDLAEVLLGLALAATCEWIARAASELAARSLGADQIDTTEIGERWASRAEAARKAALERFRRDEGAPSAAGAHVKWTPESALADQPRVSH